MPRNPNEDNARALDALTKKHLREADDLRKIITNEGTGFAWLQILAARPPRGQSLQRPPPGLLVRGDGELFIDVKAE